MRNTKGVNCHPSLVITPYYIMLPYYSNVWRKMACFRAVHSVRVRERLDWSWSTLDLRESRVDTIAHCSCKEGISIDKFDRDLLLRFSIVAPPANASISFFDLEDNNAVKRNLGLTILVFGLKKILPVPHTKPF